MEEETQASKPLRKSSKVTEPGSGHLGPLWDEWAKDDLCVLVTRLFLHCRLRSISSKARRRQTQIFFTHLIVVSFPYKWNLIINGMCSRIKKLITEGGSDYTGRKGVYDQLGIFREMAHVQRGRWARGKSRIKETEKWKGDSELDMITVLVSGVHVISCVQLVCVVLAQSCNPLCNPTDSSPSGSSVHGVFQERMLEGIAISSSRGSSPTWDQAMSPALAGWFFTTEPPGNSIDLRRGSYKYCSFWAERVHEGFCVWRK